MLSILAAFSILLDVLCVREDTYYGDIYDITDLYSWIIPRNRSWMSHMNNAVFFNPRVAAILTTLGQAGAGNIWIPGLSVNLCEITELNIPNFALRREKEPGFSS
jgi:hypothetical protein